MQKLYGRIVVAEGYTSVDEEVMLEKIKFLKRIPANENVIRFIDAVTDASRVGGKRAIITLNIATVTY